MASAALAALSLLSPPPPLLATPGTPAIPWPRWIRLFENFSSRVRSNRPACAPPKSPAAALPGARRTTRFSCASAAVNRAPATDNRDVDYRRYLNRCL
ncbi:hypothetical protein HPB50_025380 [Hyalomma asiaticum]|uniref:Uncharacterized protein n=1 Tax=Hyalomma asiaticum TaxID=266040 RepID=A0ACB7S3F0_HYAAI|nr:hypothetical protein HPB50_025380 [Hyalomma asiaticum]